MAKYARKWNQTIYRRYIREGRGQGTGMDYKPWLTVRDFPSLGMVSRIKGQTTGRIYHLMSIMKPIYSTCWTEVCRERVASAKLTYRKNNQKGVEPTF